MTLLTTLYNSVHEKYGNICAMWNNTVTTNKYQHINSALVSLVNTFY